MNFTYTLYPGNDRPPLKLYAVQGEAGSRTITIHLPGASVGGSAYAYVVKNDGHVVVICRPVPRRAGRRCTCKS